MHRDEARVVVLSSWGNPQLPEAIDALALEGVPLLAVVCAGRISARDLAIITERTAGFHAARSVFDLPCADVAFHFVGSHNGRDCLDLLDRIRPDLLLNAGTPQLLGGDVLSRAALGALSSHPGLLPEYRGSTCLEWSIYNDDPVGASCFFMDEGLDTGPVVDVETMAVDRGMTYEAVRARMMLHECRLLARAAARVVAGRITPSSLPAQGEGVRRPVMPPALLEEVKRKLATGRYASDPGSGER